MAKKVRKRISKVWGGVILLMAVIFDVFSAIPWIGLIASGIGYLVLGFIFMIKGVNPIGFTGREKKKIASFISEWIFGIVGLSVWPGITVWAIVTIRDSWEEDKERNELQRNQEKKIRQKAKQMAQKRKKQSVYR